MPAVLVAAFLLVPLVELIVIVQVQQGVGLGWTIVALIAISIVGAVMVKREGRKAWRRFRAALQDVRPPTAEVVDGAVLLFAGALLLTPGFVTDAVGLLLLLPPTRLLVYRVLRSRVRRSLGLHPPEASRRPVDSSLDVEVVDVRRTTDEAHGDRTVRGEAPRGSAGAPGPERDDPQGRQS